jgi:hypothetical protein
MKMGKIGDMLALCFCSARGYNIVIGAAQAVFLALFLLIFDCYFGLFGDFCNSHPFFEVFLTPK